MVIIKHFEFPKCYIFFLTIKIGQLLLKSTYLFLKLHNIKVNQQNNTQTTPLIR